MRISNIVLNERPIFRIAGHCLFKHCTHLTMLKIIKEAKHHNKNHKNAQERCVSTIKKKKKKALN